MLLRAVLRIDERAGLKECALQAKSRVQSSGSRQDCVESPSGADTLHVRGAERPGWARLCMAVTSRVSTGSPGETHFLSFPLGWALLLLLLWPPPSVLLKGQGLGMESGRGNAASAPVF